MITIKFFSYIEHILFVDNITDILYQVDQKLMVDTILIKDILTVKTFIEQWDDVVHLYFINDLYKSEILNTIKPKYISSSSMYGITWLFGSKIIFVKNVPYALLAISESFTTDVIISQFTININNIAVLYKGYYICG